MRKEQLAEDLEREREKLQLKLDSANVAEGIDRHASEAYVPVKLADIEGSTEIELHNASTKLLESVLNEAEDMEAEESRRRETNDRSVMLFEEPYFRASHRTALCSLCVRTIPLNSATRFHCINKTCMSIL